MGGARGRGTFVCSKQVLICSEGEEAVGDRGEGGQWLGEHLTSVFGPGGL